MKSLYNHPRFTAAVDLLAKGNLVAAWVRSYMIGDPGEPEEPFIRIGVNTDTDTIVDLNFRLADTLAEGGLIPAPDGEMEVVVMFVPA